MIAITVIRTWIDDQLVKSKQGRQVAFILLLLFAIAPFQRRFHGVMDSLSRKIILPDFPLPEFFSRKIHLYVSDPLILILTVILLISFKIRLRAFFFSGPSKYLTLLFFVSLASIFFSITRTYVLQYLMLLQFSMIFLFFNSLRCAFEKIDLSVFLKKFACVVLAVSCVECVISSCQYVSQASIGLGFLGEPDIHHFPFLNPGKHRWLFDRILNSANPYTYLYRASGTFSHPNILGGFIFCSLMASYYLCMKEDQRIKRLCVLCSIPLQIFTLYIAYSRSAMLALTVSTLFFCLLQFKQIAIQQGWHFAAFKRFAVLSSTVIVGGLIGIGVFYSQISARGGIFNYNQVTQFADSERAHYLKIAMQMIKEHPLLGVGFNNFQLFVEKYQPMQSPHIFFAKVHNIYLLIASETGLIGGALFSLFLLAILKETYTAIFSGRKRPVEPDAQEKFFLAATFLGLLLIGFFDFYFINTLQGRILFFGFAALLCAVCKQRPNVTAY